MRRRRRAVGGVGAALALALVAVVAASAQQEPEAPLVAAIDLRPQAADFSRAALAEFEAQQAERAKDDEVYIAPAPGAEEEEEQAAAAATTATAATAATAAPVVVATPTPTPTPTTAAAATKTADPPQPRAMAIARGTVAKPGTEQQQQGAAAGADPPTAPLAPRKPPLVFPTEFPPTPSPRECQSALQDYRAHMSREPAPFDGPEGQSLVYFLHIPRTAGRTFHVCLLRQATPPDRRCPKSYDHLRVDVSLPK
jgi:hypothetical protein